MPADPPLSLLVTPDLRRRLQQRYDEAARLAAQKRPDLAGIHALLAECLQADPGNILYIDALLANLRRREKKRERSWWRTWLAWLRRSAISPLSAKCDKKRNSEPASPAGMPCAAAHSLLSAAPEQLWRQPANLPLLRTIAEAAAVLEFDEAELRYLFAARDIGPDDPETLRMLARALTRQGRFEDAVGPWFAVLALTGGPEAAEAVEDLRGSQETIEAEHTLASAHAAAGGDLAILQQREDACLARSTFRVELARRRASHDAHPRAQALVARLAAEHNRQEIEIFHARAERWPRNAAVRIELARSLKLAGNHSGAIQRLDEALQLSDSDPAALIELGENWQHLRQFPKALDYYRRAIGAAEPGPHEGLNLARYRAAVLATALGQFSSAREWLDAIVATDPVFKDARERLDNLPAT